MSTDTTRYAIITPAGVIRFGLVSGTTNIEFLDKKDATTKIHSEWDTGELNISNSCRIINDQVGLWFCIGLSDPAYGSPKYYVWDTNENQTINIKIISIETSFANKQ